VDDIDKSAHSKVKRRFYKVLDPLNKRVNDFYEENALNKQKLINKAVQFASLDDALEPLREATEEAKALQQKWKAISFAGKDKENLLWQAFREANDQLFARYNTLVSASQAQNDEVIKTVEQNVAQIQQQVTAAASKSDLSFYAEAVQALEQSLDALDDKSKLKISRKLKTLEDTHQRTSQKLDESKANSDLQTLFDYLMSSNTDIAEQAKDNADAPTLESLANRYKVWLKGDVKPVEVLQGLSRNDLVQVALIISDDNANSLKFGDENRRKELQMQLMAAKLGGGEQVSLESVLASWVAQKAVKTDEVDGLKVLQEFFLTRTI
jgi:exonuclease SbcC